MRSILKLALIGVIGAFGLSAGGCDWGANQGADVGEDEGVVGEEGVMEDEGVIGEDEGIVEDEGLGNDEGLNDEGIDAPAIKEEPPQDAPSALEDE